MTETHPGWRDTSKKSGSHLWYATALRRRERLDGWDAYLPVACYYCHYTVLTRKQDVRLRARGTPLAGALVSPRTAHTSPTNLSRIQRCITHIRRPISPMEIHLPT